MPAPTTRADFLECLRKSGLVDNQRLGEYLQRQRHEGPLSESVRSLSLLLVRDGFLTGFQAEQLRQGKWRNFFIKGKYKVMERLGTGGNATVFLCEHTAMRRAVALKVLPSTLPANPAILERFYREARIAAQLKHANLVSAYDVDQAGALHFLVMEYIDGHNLHHLVTTCGPLAPVRAAHYIRQAAEGLQHAHERGMVHRDVKPGNVLLDRSGTIKILDMGLARFFHEEDNLTQKYNSGAVLGTADFLSPEQALDSHGADIRSDIYSLGITFYFLLTGASPFEAGTTAQKLLWHQLRQPRPVRSIRPDIPEDMAAVLEKMTAKAAEQRYQTPAEVGAALAPWTQTEIPPPGDEEMPQHLPVLRTLCQQGPPSGRSFTASLRPAFAEPATPLPGGLPSPQPPDEDPTVLPAGAAASDTCLILRDEANPAVRSSPPTAVAHDLPERPTPGLAPRPRRSRPLVVAAIGGAALVAAAALLVLVLSPAPSSGPQPTGPAVVSINPPPAAAPGTKKTDVPPPPLRQVVFSREGGAHRVRAPGYEAVVEADGCMTSLRIGGLELFQNGADLSATDQSGARISRGSYFYDEGGPGGVVELAEVRQTEDSITARSAITAIEHRFTADTVAWKLDNLTSHEVRYYIVFHPNVRAVGNDRGELALVPLEKEWGTTSWFAGAAKLTLTGGNRIWGPWGGKYQVWQVTLPPKETRRVTAVADNASAAELARIQALPRPDSPPKK